MNFVDPYNRDMFEEWLTSEKKNYEDRNQYSYSIIVREILNKYRNFKENQKGVKEYGREE
jgi:hypothetical protein